MVMRLYLTVLVGVLASLAVVPAAMTAAKAQTPGGQREAYVDVGVATLWVEPGRIGASTNGRSQNPPISGCGNGA
jgi:hypothetical protein